jgi:hypothetical protein
MSTLRLGHSDLLIPCLPSIYHIRQDMDKPATESYLSDCEHSSASGHK